LNIAGELKATILRRPEIGLDDLIVDGYDPAAKAMVEEEIKYQGYIEREKREIRRLSELEGVRLPNLDFSSTPGLSREIREKLGAVRPATLGQASRIPGMTPAALAVLRIYARRVGA
jgi:tRNA uridine 5-carboxymethylaminomethyl modification enzyme